MIFVKPADLTPSFLSGLIRNFVYPTVPYIGVACIWAHAYAVGMESKLIPPRPHEDEFILRESAREAAVLERLQGEQSAPAVTSLDETDKD